MYRGRTPDPRVAPEPPPVEGARWIALSLGKFALVDEADYEQVFRYNWSCSRVKGYEGKFYAVSRLGGGKLVRLHRFLLGEVAPHIDHHDGDGLNNRRTNLRPSTCSQNLANRGRPSHNKSGFKGVHWDARRSLWVAQISVRGKHKYLGRFADIKEAAAAYDRAAFEAHREFAVLNFGGRREEGTDHAGDSR